MIVFLRSFCVASFAVKTSTVGVNLRAANRKMNHKERLRLTFISVNFIQILLVSYYVLYLLKYYLTNG